MNLKAPMTDRLYPIDAVSQLTHDSVHIGDTGVNGVPGQTGIPEQNGVMTQN